MKFAQVNGKRVEANKSGELGHCPFCNNQMRAYCGPLKVHHWKHISLELCDTWHEPETDWHREWKNYFDHESQEVIKKDPLTGEKHIADVYLHRIDLVIEFQHSPITLSKLAAREDFYKKMIWVVDAEPHLDKIKLRENDYSNFYNHVIQPLIRMNNAEARRLKKEKGYSEEQIEIFHKEKWDYITSFEEKLEEDYTDKNYFLLEWKYLPERWKVSSCHLFFDLRDLYIYHIIEIIENANVFLVKRYSKQDFLIHYMR